MPRRIDWVRQDEVYPVYMLDTDIPDLPPGLVARYHYVMNAYFAMQRELANLYHNKACSLDWRDGARKVDHPAVPDDSIPLPYEEYDQ